LDIDGFDLISELNILREIIGVENNKSIDIFNYIKRINSFPNVYITYRIMLTILVLRSTMSQKILNELVILSIEK